VNVRQHFLQILLHIIEDANEQVEAQARQVAHALLASHKKEAAAGERRMREQYDTRLREKQIQLNLVQTRLQVSFALVLRQCCMQSIHSACRDTADVSKDNVSEEQLKLQSTPSMELPLKS